MYCELLLNGVPIYTIQAWMRYSTVQTTQNYADLLKHELVGGVLAQLRCYKPFIQFIPEVNK